ncbi:hypothetical protein J3L16_13260 [Alteromonas sp. 5E99-2]|uniref:hypothetical protein n=1 Tax=Alteromonas sp. 5E99-2 TaxID=2817683 RepID=UPI001A984849|nr:hypothetical protein [Alteromonas sp. 5E99-2]MBO1256654.1 hypothetical protein [Alteromonas sp. 5E99-2]
MKKQLDINYPSLSDIDIDFEAELECSRESSCEDKSYTFETHPFYSQLGTVDFEMPDND